VKYLPLIERIFENFKERQVYIALRENRKLRVLVHNNITMHITRQMNFVK
jgi:hypothetical protein